MRLPRFVLPLACAALLAVFLQASAQVATPPRDYRVLLVGNSLTYTNNLPALLRAVGASQGSNITTETYAAPGGMLADRLKDGFVAEALRNRRFDVVVLQEQGGKLAACMADGQEQRKAPCAASLRAYSEISSIASQVGVKTLIFTTWGPDARWQAKLDRSANMIADKTSADVFNAAGALRALRKASQDVSMFPDGTHPSTQASLMLAVALYRVISGVTPAAKDLRVNAPLLPVSAAVSADSAMETQAGLAGNGKVTVIPARLIEPLIRALPAAGSEKMDPSRRRR